ncbi:MarR family winged helix-turn-helix transcriptional regulator [Pararobbsia alpina]|uniref:Transcriptional regulator SlyA n=1 Tax=Pararobbsia alpina TaxID=621374 RepID=A0A6S7BQS8_9BURK|nr:MarR family transcriptional regulator [Pararobbsia alpina]CAB3799506.1 Transcriptional regulator SlyA [Pararobbsia alpina]
MPNIHDLRLSVTGGLVRIARQWRRASHHVLAGYGVSEACATPLLMIGRLGEGVRQRTLAEHVGIEGPSLVRLLDQLCSAGLAVRQDDPADGRAKTIWLTDNGRALRAQIETALISLRAEKLKGISAADLAATLRVFKAIELAAGQDRATDD